MCIWEQDLAIDVTGVNYGSVLLGLRQLNTFNEQ